MGKLYTIKKLIKAVKDKKSLFIFSEKDNTQCLSIPLEECNIDLSITLFDVLDINRIEYF